MYLQYYIFNYYSIFIQTITICATISEKCILKHLQNYQNTFAFVVYTRWGFLEWLILRIIEREYFY